MQITDIFEDDDITTTHLIACTTAEIRLLAVLTMEPLRQILEGNLQIPDMPMADTITMGPNVLPSSPPTIQKLIPRPRFPFDRRPAITGPTA